MSSRPDRRRAPRARPEQAIQRTCADILARFVPKPPEGPFFTSINPVPAKSKAVAGISKAMGMRAGVPDLWMLQRGQSILVEFKADNGRLSTAQKTLREEIISAGGVVEVAKSAEEFLGILATYNIPCKLHKVDINSNGPFLQDFR